MQHNANTFISVKTSRAHCDNAIGSLSEIAALIELMGNHYLEHPHYPLFATLQRLVDATRHQLGDLDSELASLATRTE